MRTINRKKTSERVILKARRKSRGRKKISGTDERPRLSVFKTCRHVYVQVINDMTGNTLASASSFESNSATTTGSSTRG